LPFGYKRKRGMEDKIKSIDGHIREARSLVNVMITAAENIYEPNGQ
jgi:hypothetical protein